jgi:rhodanese-related sulfurtransferase
VTNLSLTELAARLDARTSGDDAFQLVNVHIPHTIDIVGTDATAAFNNIDAIVAAVGDNLGAEIILYCKTGPMSVAATTALKDLGYCHIYDLPDGYTQWQSAGYPVE